MKNLQTHFLKFSLFLSFFFVAHSLFANSALLNKVDSLFRLKFYTQSFEIYQSILQTNRYSPAMLLKMAFIQEGLGNIGQSMYYLRLYQHSTDDPQVLEKINELSGKYNLSGYEESDASRVYRWMNKNLLLLQITLAGIIFLLTVVIYFQKQKGKSLIIPILMSMALTISLVYLNNFIETSSVITNQNRVYLMSGPSAGASVTNIVGDGNQFQVLGKEDVWLKVKWNDKIVFIKESSVLKITL